MPCYDDTDARLRFCVGEILGWRDAMSIKVGFWRPKLSSSVTRFWDSADNKSDLADRSPRCPSGLAISPSWLVSQATCFDRSGISNPTKTSSTTELIKIRLLV